VPWAQFDDHFPDSEPALNAGVEACGLHLLATCWSAAHLTDGEVPSIIVKRLMSGCLDNQGAEIVARLMEAGLWEHRESGYVLTDFLVSNRSRAQVEASRVDRRAAGRKGGHAKAAKRKPPEPVAVPEVEPDPYEQEQSDLPF